MKFSIPFNQRVFRDFKLFVVSALVENEGRALYMPMIIDSAASYLTVRPDVFSQLGVLPARKIPIVTASQRAEAPVGRVNRITVGADCSAGNIDIISIPLPADLPAEGLLGASFLQNFVVSIDYRNGKLELDTLLTG